MTEGTAGAYEGEMVKPIKPIGQTSLDDIAISEVQLDSNLLLHINRSAKTVYHASDFVVKYLSVSFKQRQPLKKIKEYIENIISAEYQLPENAKVFVSEIGAHGNDLFFKLKDGYDPLKPTDRELELGGGSGRTIKQDTPAFTYLLRFVSDAGQSSPRDEIYKVLAKYVKE